MAQKTIVAKHDEKGVLVKVKLSTGLEEFKLQVVGNIESKTDSYDVKGASVKVVNRSAVKYLRTDNNQTDGDNLENCPSY